MNKPVARLTSSAQLIASLPLWLGFVPAESLVVLCCHEPRGRLGLTMRFDLPRPGDEELLVREVERRVRHQRATRVVVAVYTAEAAPAHDPGQLPRTALVDALRERFADLRITEAVVVRDGRFWSYLCDREACCPAAGTSLEAARDEGPVRLLEAELVLRGQCVLPDREALEATLAAPTSLVAQLAAHRCELAMSLLADAIEEAGVARAGEESLRAWWATIARFHHPPAVLGDMEAAALAVSLADVWVRDQLAAVDGHDVPALLLLLQELARRTPVPYDAAVCALLAWLTYCEGGGSLVTIALERALTSDPEHGLARLLEQALTAQVAPDQLRRISRASRGLERGAC